jgi:DNA-binding GntR family transcriptional regulator
MVHLLYKVMDIRRADSIAQELEQMIFTGRFADGDRLDEARLAERFGVSRTPLREALQKLAVSGLVEQVPRRGVFVRQPGPVELLGLFEAMAELEAACARLAAARITDAALADLRAANRICREALSRGDTDAYYTENARFHHILYAASGNAYLETEARRLHRRLQPFRRRQLQLRGRMPQSMAEHETIVAALEAGDASAAATALRDHVAVQGEKFHHLLSGLQASRG